MLRIPPTTAANIDSPIITTVVLIPPPIHLIVSALRFCFPAISAALPAKSALDIDLKIKNRTSTKMNPAKGLIEPFKSENTDFPAKTTKKKAAIANNKIGTIITGLKNSNV